MRAINLELLRHGPLSRADRRFGASIITLRHRVSAPRHPLRRSRLSLEIIGGALLVSDLCVVATAAAAVFLVYADAMGDPEPGRYIITTLFAATVFVVWLERLGGYRLPRLIQLGPQLAQLLVIWAGTISLLLLIAFISKMSQSYSRGWALGTIFAAAGLLSAERCISHFVLKSWVRSGSIARRVAIVGAGDVGQRLITSLQQSKDPSFVVCGVFDDRKSRVPSSVCGLSILGTTDDLINLARQNTVDEVIVALPLNAEDRLRTLFYKLKGVACDLRLSAEPLAQSLQVHGMTYVGDVPVLAVSDRPLKPWHCLVKWLEDKVLASIMLVAVSPILAITALAIKLDSRGPVLFVQKRFGFNNDVIEVLKFRTMHIGRCDESGASRTIKSDPRVTRVGRVLRWLSLDELPQLVNVLRGDMSLVGPRPHALAMKAGDRLYSEVVEQYLHRHRVKPGITGWAQVNGLRGEVDTLEKGRARVTHDLYYIENWSLWLDVKILIKTLGMLTLCENAY